MDHRCTGIYFVGNECNSNVFMVTPYKYYLSILIESFLIHKSNFNHVQIGRFSRLIIRLIHSLDTPFIQVKSALDSINISTLSSNVDNRLEEIINKGIDTFIKIPSFLLTFSNFHPSSFLGLFIRKMSLFFDKLSFTAMTGLFVDFKNYVSNGQESMKQVTFEPSRTDPSIQNEDLWKNCPKQVDYFFSKQVKLLSIDEKKALSPEKLAAMVAAAMKTNSADCTTSNGLNFVRFLNNVRVHEYHGSIESLKIYFDLVGQSNNKCWSSFNLAHVYYQFGHFDLAIESIKEAISAAQEFNDEKCLESVLLLFVKILLRKNNRTKSGLKSDLGSDVIPLLIHLQSKSNSLQLPAISSLAALHLEQLIGGPCKKFLEENFGANSSFGASSGSFGANSGSGSNSFFPIHPEVVCIKNSLNSLLMSVYGNKSGHFSSVGLSRLASVTSQLLLHLYAAEIVGDQLVHHVNEATCIGIRNLALELWTNHGMYQSSVDLLYLCSDLFSIYNSNVNEIWRQALAEINFEHALMSRRFAHAQNEVESIKLFDLDEAKLRLIQLLMKRGSLSEAYDELLQLEKGSSNNCSDYFKLRLNLVKSELIKSVTLTLKCVEEAKEKHFFALQAKSYILLAEQLIDLHLRTQSLLILRRCFIFILSNGGCLDIAKASRLFALNYRSLAFQPLNNDQANETPILNETPMDEGSLKNLNLALSYNLRAIENYEKMGDVDSLLDCYKFQAFVSNSVGKISERNFYSRKYKKLSNNNNHH